MDHDSITLYELLRVLEDYSDLAKDFVRLCKSTDPKEISTLHDKIVNTISNEVMARYALATETLRQRATSLSRDARVRSQGGIA